MIQRNRSASWKTEYWKSLKLNIKEKHIFTNENSLTDLWDNNNNTYYMGPKRRGEKESDKELTQ